VENCIISNNAAVRGGGVHCGTVSGCLVVENYASANRSGISESYLYNTVVDRNRGQNSAQNIKVAVNCTFGGDCLFEDGAKAAYCIAYPSGPVVNCLILGTCALTGTSRVDAYSNCVFQADAFSKVKDTEADLYLITNDCVMAGLDNLLLDGYTPVYGSCAAIDAGSNEALSALSGEYAAKDVFGGQRVYNGTVDAGAAEFDYRPLFKAALGGAVGSVESATPGVSLSDEGRVRLSGGDSLCATVSAEGRVQASFSVTDGVLSGEVCGAAFETAETGKLWFSASGLSNSMTVAFAGGGHADLGGLKKFGAVVVFR
jgi:hypothetical protein